jgi:polar amino acid transport system substrate-binding protein
MLVMQSFIRRGPQHGLMLCLILGAPGPARAQDAITLHFYDRPPYMVAEGDGAVGLTASAAEQALRKADLVFSWKRTPAKRQLMLLERGTGSDCGVGWYKSAEREKFGKFSAPIYRDRPTVAIARAGYVPASRRLADIVADPKLRILVKDGLTYGPDAHRILTGTAVKAKIQKATAEQSTLALMIAAGRADLMLSPEEEASLLMASHAEELRGLKVLEFSDIGHGETRHILCSPGVSNDTMARINAALATMPSIHK